jgi:purine-binding chemotaxis protein CheW
MKQGEKDPTPAGRIDWDAVHSRLAAAQAALQQGWTPDPETIRAILKERARQLALEPAAADAGDGIEIVEFLLAAEHYGIETAFVREVCSLKDLTPVPCTPAHVLGIINVRGRILSLIDLREFLELPAKGLDDLNRVIILGAGGMEFGILADGIVGARQLPTGSLQRGMPTLMDIRVEYLKGIAEDRTIVLDGGKILSSARIVVNEEVRL